MHARQQEVQIAAGGISIRTLSQTLSMNIYAAFLVVVFSKYFHSNLLLVEIRRKFALTRPRGSH